MSDLWTEDYFDTVYLRRWSLGPPTEMVFREVDFLISQLDAAPSSALLDVACGQGRYSIAFATRGLRVTGLDASEVLLQEARRLALEAGTSVDWVMGDMRSLPKVETHDYAVLLDAFGFFDSGAENEEVIRQLRRAVVPDGRVVITVVNGTWILNALEPVAHEQYEGRVVEICRRIESERRVLHEQIVVTEGGYRYAGQRRQRLYSVSELGEIISRNGLRIQSLYGDMTGDSFREDTSRKIVMICDRARDA